MVVLVSLETTLRLMLNFWLMFKVNVNFKVNQGRLTLRSQLFLFSSYVYGLQHSLKVQLWEY